MSLHVTKCHTCHGICTLSPLDAALTTDFAKNTQQKCCAHHEKYNSSSENEAKVLRLPRCHTTTFDTFSDTRECQEVPRLPRKTTLQPALAPSKRIVLQLPSIDTAQMYSACHTERLLTRYGTCWNVTKCHACHSTRGYATFETSKATAFATLPIGTAIIATSSRTVANGCRRLPTVANTKAASSEHVPTPRPPE